MVKYGENNDWFDWLLFNVTGAVFQLSQTINHVMEMIVSYFIDLLEVYWLKF